MIALKPSRLGRFLELAIWSSITILTVVILKMPLQLLFLSLLAIILFLIKKQGVINVIRIQRNGLFSLESSGSYQQNMKLTGNSISTSWACVLYFEREKPPCSQCVVIWRDSLAEPLFRRLRAWLKWSAAPCRIVKKKHHQ